MPDPIVKRLKRAKFAVITPKLTFEEIDEIFDYFWNNNQVATILQEKYYGTFCCDICDQEISEVAFIVRAYPTSHKDFPENFYLCIDRYSCKFRKSVL